MKGQHRGATGAWQSWEPSKGISVKVELALFLKTQHMTVSALHLALPRQCVPPTPCVWRGHSHTLALPHARTPARSHTHTPAAVCWLVSPRL